MPVDFYIEDERSGVDVDRQVRFAEMLLQAAGEADAEVSIAVVTDDQIRSLNRRYRGIDAATDVLSFAQREGPSLGQGFALGDVVISHDAAQRQAAELGHSLDDEISELVFHGFLHLAGHDHAGERRPQWDGMEDRLIRALQQQAAPFVPCGLTDRAPGTCSGVE